MKTLTAEGIRKALRDARAPLTREQLAERLGVDRARGRRELSRQLTGMVRNGELERDHRGAFHLPGGAGETLEGVLERDGRSLMLEGLPVGRGKRSWLRAGDRVLASRVDEEARVLSVLERSPEPLVAVLRTHTRYPYAESLSPDYRGRVSLVEPPVAGQDGDTVTLRIVDEDRRGLVGLVTDTLARGGGAAQAATTMLANYSVPVEFPPEVAAQLERLPQRVNAGAHGDRRSLMELPLVTIDGETARDFDDAVYAETRRGGWRLVVAIADVANYVRAGSALDHAAAERGTSVYLPDRVVPMLPELLSNELCSLKPQVPRLALVCDMTVSRAGRVTGYSFYEAVIRSWQRLTYTRVQEFFDTGALDVEREVRDSLTALDEVFAAFLEARSRRGGLDFETHESRLELAGDRVLAVHPVQRLRAHRLIEEAMIAANVAAASFLEDAGLPLLYRIHAPPKADRVEELRQALAFAGVRLGRGELKPADLADALARLGDRPERWLYEYLVLRSLSQAVYSPENAGHFGLALERYAHFTSPIRRYPDLLVHRAIKRQLAGKGAPLSFDALVAAGQQSSQCERRADEVAWGVDAWLKCEYVSERIGEVFDGVVMAVTEFGLFVELSGYYVQGLLHVSGLGQDYFQYRPSSLALVGERSGRRFALGDELRVRLVGVEPEQGKLDLELVAGEGRDTSRQPRRRHRRRES